MLRLDYKIDRDTDVENISWTDVDDVSLGYWCFFGDIILESNSANLSTNWGWIPLLSFALQIRFAADETRNTKPQSLEFLGSDQSIHFTPRREVIQITADYTDQSIFVTAGELSHASASMLARFRSEVEDRHPGLLANHHYANLIARMTVA